jgi:hypothetical protein
MIRLGSPGPALRQASLPVFVLNETFSSLNPLGHANVRMPDGRARLKTVDGAARNCYGLVVNFNLDLLLARVLLLNSMAVGF